MSVTMGHSLPPLCALFQDARHGFLQAFCSRSRACSFTAWLDTMGGLTHQQIFLPPPACSFTQLVKAMAARMDAPESEVVEPVRNVLMSLVNVSQTQHSVLSVT